MGNEIELKLKIDIQKGTAQIKKIDGDIKKLGATAGIAAGGITGMTGATTMLAASTGAVGGATVAAASSVSIFNKTIKEQVERIKKNTKTMNNMKKAAKALGKTIEQVNKDTGGTYALLVKNNKKLRKQTTAVKRLNAVWAKHKVGLLAAAAAATTVGVVFVKAFNSAVDYGDKLGKLSVRLGINASELDKLNRIAELSDVNFTALSTSLQRLTRRVAAAAKGEGEAVKSLKALGIEAKALTKLPLEKQFITVATALDKVENAGDKVRLTMQLMDTEGVATIQMFSGLSGKMDSMTSMWDNQTAKNMEEFNDNLVIMKRVLGDLTVVVSQEVVDYLNTLMDIKGNPDAFKEWSTNAVKDIREVAKETKKTITPLVRLIKTVMWLNKQLVKIHPANVTKSMIEGVVEAKTKREEPKFYPIAPKPTFGDSTTVGPTQEEINTAKARLQLEKRIHVDLLFAKGEYLKAEREQELLRYENFKAINGKVEGALDLHIAKLKKITVDSKKEEDRITKQQNKEKLQLQQNLNLNMLSLNDDGRTLDLERQRIAFAKEKEAYIEHSLDIQEVIAWDRKAREAINSKYDEEDREEQLEKDRERREGMTPQGSLKETLDGLYDGFEDEGKDVLAKYLGIADDGGFANEIQTTLVDPMTNFFDSMVSGTESAGDAFRVMVVSMLKSISTLIIKMLVLRAVEQTVGMFGGGVGEIASAGSGFNFNLADSFKSNPMGNSPTGFADGGIIKRPTLGLIGEGKYNEAVIPLPDGKNVPVKMNGSGNSTVNIVNNITVESSGEEGQQDNEQAVMIAQAIDVKITQSLIKEQRPGGLLHMGR